MNRVNCIVLAVVLLSMLTAGIGCATFSVQKGDEDASAKMAEAQNLLRKSDYAHAIAEFRKVIQEHPNTAWAANAKYGIAMAYVSANNRHKDYAVAVAEFDEFIDQYPKDERISEARNWRHALKVLLETKKENDRLNKNIEKLKQLDVRQEEKRSGK